MLDDKQLTFYLYLLTMNKPLSFDLSNCNVSNDLWSKFINFIGLSKAKLAIRQSLDLQDMQGNTSTLPVLIFETCGSALVRTDALRYLTGLPSFGQGMVLIYSTKSNSVQLLREN